MYSMSVLLLTDDSLDFPLDTFILLEVAFVVLTQRLVLLFKRFLLFGILIPQAF